MINIFWITMLLLGKYEVLAGQKNIFNKITWKARVLSKRFYKLLIVLRKSNFKFNIHKINS